MQQKIVSKFCLAATVVLLSSCGPGQSTESKLQVRNGSTDGQDLPFVFVLEETSDGTNWRSTCSAVYLGERLVLTAGHCFRNQTDAIKDIQDIIPLDLLRIRTASGNTFSIDRAYFEPVDWGRLRSSKRIFTGFKGYDLTLLELASEPIEKGAPVLEPDRSTSGFGLVMEEQTLTLAGYEGTYQLTQGQQPSIRYLDPAQTFLLAGTGTRAGTAICTGDSGGGVFVKTDNGYALKGIISFLISRNFGVMGSDQGECETGVYSGIVDLQQPGAANFIARAKESLSNVENGGPIIFKTLSTSSTTPGRIEAENFVSGADFSFGNQGDKGKTNSLQSNIDIFSEESSSITFVGATETGETLTYAVETNLEGSARLNFRLRNASDKRLGRIVVRTDQRSIELKLTTDTLDWQTLSVPIDGIKPQRTMRLGVEILSPVDIDWFSLEKP